MSVAGSRRPRSQPHYSQAYIVARWHFTTDNRNWSDGSPADGYSQNNNKEKAFLIGTPAKPGCSTLKIFCFKKIRNYFIVLHPVGFSKKCFIYGFVIYLDCMFLPANPFAFYRLRWRMLKVYTTKKISEYWTEMAYSFTPSNSRVFFFKNLNKTKMKESVTIEEFLIQ